MVWILILVWKRADGTGDRRWRRFRRHGVLSEILRGMYAVTTNGNETLEFGTILSWFRVRFPKTCFLSNTRHNYCPFYYLLYFLSLVSYDICDTCTFSHSFSYYTQVFRWMKSLGHGVDETMTALIISNAYERIKSQKQVSADRAMDYLSSRISTMKLLAHVETQKNGTTCTDRKKIGGGGLLAKAHIQHPSEEGNGHDGHGYGSGIRVKTNPVQQHEVLENGSSTDPVPINVSHRTPSTTCSTTATTSTAATKSKITTPSSELSKPNPSESKTRKQIQSSSSSKSQPKNKSNTLKPNTNTKNSNNTNTKQSTTTACGKNLKSSCNSIRGKRTLLAATLEEHTQELLSQSSCTKRPRLDSV